jgi:hypothetical protein
VSPSVGVEVSVVESVSPVVAFGSVGCVSFESDESVVVSFVPVVFDGDELVFVASASAVDGSYRSGTDTVSASGSLLPESPRSRSSVTENVGVRDAVVPSACVDDPSVSATLPTRYSPSV